MTTLFQVFSLILFFTLSSFFQKKTILPPLKLTKQQSALNFNKKIYSTISAGHQRLFSTYIWVQTLIESDLDHYKKVDLSSWMYHRFDAMTFLEPKFYAAYRFGAQYLSIVKDDEKGALDIYLKGLKQYPNDYDLNFNLGFHYLFEMGLLEESSQYFSKVMFHKNAPVYLPSLVSKIKQKQGDLDFAFKLLKDSYEKTDERSPLKKSLFQKAYALKAQIDLNCLNSFQNKTCDKMDLRGNQYNFKDNKYYAQEKWELPKVNFKKR